MAISKKHIVIVGGTGGMGKLFTRLWRKQKHKVTPVGRKTFEAKKHLLAEADLVIVSVPIDATERTIQKVAPHLGKSTILADFTSIKAQPVTWMKAAFKGPVLGLHPVFGPSVKNMRKQVVVACPARKKKACDWVLASLKKTGLKVETMTPKNHDEFMTIIQAIKHFSTYCLGQFLHKKGVDLNKTLKLSSPIYRLELDMLGRIFSQSPELYADIVMADDTRIDMIGEFVKTINTLYDGVQHKKRAAFIKNFSKTSSWMGDFAKQAMKESDAVINQFK